METTLASETNTEASLRPERPLIAVEQTVFPVLFAISFSHLLNDLIQALIPSLYPLLKQTQGLTFGQIGMITFTFQCTASLLQPLVGIWTDKRPMPYSLAVGMGLTLVGLLTLSQAHSYPFVILSAMLVGLGSAVFHPEASRVAHMAAGRSRGLAQSVFQVGGNAGSAIGPALAAIIVLHGSQGHVAWFSVVAGLGIIVLWRIGTWQALKLAQRKKQSHAAHASTALKLPKRTVMFSLAILIALTFSKYVYLVSLTNYYTFYLMERFHVSMAQSQFYLFYFLAAVAAGTIIGGPVGDRIGRKRVIWVSILGVAPFTLLLPYASLPLTVVLTICIGLVLASAFSAILVFAQELLPGKVGMVAGLFFGIAFGIAGIGAAFLGKLADHVGIISVFHMCAYLPLIGLLTVFLPDIKEHRK